jgi:SAM-dependent methyltransferase
MEVLMNNGKIIENNKSYWDANADFWFGTTALPEYGVKFVTEDDLHLFGDVSGKKMLEICCGSGHSLKYHADRNAGELWGVDLSPKQLDNAKKFLSENGYTAKLICSPMEAELDVPKNYFDYVYSIYGIGWTTDLQGTFDNIASYLRKDGIFIFSWHHTLNYCVAWSCSERKDIIENDKLVFSKSYFDESYFTMPVDDSEIILCNRKISTYVNALAKAGFVIEQMIEQNDRATMESTEDISDKTRKAKMLPISLCFKARKL